ncbi:ATP synthase F1 subunit epsilon [Clostridium sp.]|uniref:ATP synthase F1 subunit epsilon n=1 Tax=Clostridium sp. TaxID=1506 RepID=UPI00261EFA53|nr:ATP synthase F1 subunit epsilon [Clostridium sp.]
MNKTFEVNIISPGKEVITYEVEGLKTLTGNGEIEFKANHTPIITNTIPTTTILTTEQGKEKIFTSTGIIYIKDNVLKFCCDSSEKASDVDESRAEESKKRAEKRINESKDMDIERAIRSLSRANARLETVSKNN